MKKATYLLSGIIMGIAMMFIIAHKPGDDSTQVSQTPEGTLYFPAIKIPLEIDFAGEAVPLDDFEVRERLDRELLVNGYWHSSTLQNLKLANRWFPTIEKILEENDVPDDFKYLAVIESGLRNLVSPAKAEGVWQILKSTGQGYGLTINSEVDERYDIEKACVAACKYFKEAHEKFDNWTLAAASYNMGMGGVSSKLKSQGVDSYYDLLLNSETSRYVLRALAFKAIYSDPAKYGFYIDNDDLYEPIEYRTVEVKSSITDLATFAKKEGTTYKMVKTLNPWLRSTKLTVATGKVYEIKLPMK